MKAVKMRVKTNENKGEMDENIKHLVFGVCIAFVVLGAFVGVASATTLHVDDDRADYPDADFTSIQDAVDAASGGDTIIVQAANSNDGIFEVEEVIA